MTELLCYDLGSILHNTRLSISAGGYVCETSFEISNFGFNNSNSLASLMETQHVEMSKRQWSSHQQSPRHHGEKVPGWLLRPRHARRARRRRRGGLPWAAPLV